MKLRQALPATLAALSLGITLSQPLTAGEFSQAVDSQGNISLPADFRKNMTHLGSWFVPEGPASGFHDVYTENSSVEAFRREGKFPDGAVLIKELRASESGDYTTGKGVHYATSTATKQHFVMIKDSSNRFKNNGSWGDGWGWALFKGGAGSPNVSTDYTKDCLGCHIPAKERDWLYTEAYPTLSEP
ncbi:MAG: cytochrome P460 family protein [Motiliproteus sp.]|nr:cytochrome P460 family protein [Motiliproteus sp.]MCW9054108.1 cytochrome P460 family protein [Motiliproteus sp.]